MKDLGVVIVNYHTDALLTRLLTSLEKFKPKATLDIVVQDVEKQESFPLSEAYYTYNKYPDNIGYAQACNWGALDLDVRHLLFLNADTLFTNSECIDICVDFLDQNPDVGAVGPMQVDSVGKVTHAGIFGTLDHPSHRGWLSRQSSEFEDVQDAVTVSGSAYFTPVSVWVEMTECPLYKDISKGALGGFLPTPLYYEETYYSYHLHAHDYRVVYNGNAQMIHEWNQSPQTGQQGQKFKISQEYFRKACDHHSIPHD